MDVNVPSAQTLHGPASKKFEIRTKASRVPSMKDDSSIAGALTKP